MIDVLTQAFAVQQGDTKLSDSINEQITKLEVVRDQLAKALDDRACMPVNEEQMILPDPDRFITMFKVRRQEELHFAKGNQCESEGKPITDNTYHVRGTRLLCLCQNCQQTKHNEKQSNGLVSKVRAVGKERRNHCNVGEECDHHPLGTPELELARDLNQSAAVRVMYFCGWKNRAAPESTPAHTAQVVNRRWSMSIPEMMGAVIW